MMVKITERCTMGCKHCMNDSQPDGEDMSLDTLRDTLNFFKKNQICRSFILTGGEPLEHGDFPSVLEAIYNWNDENGHYVTAITVTTNGEKIQNDGATYQQYLADALSHGIILMFQVSADLRYYPRRIAVHRKVFRSGGFIMCDNCVQAMYPQGRARDNDLPWQSKASKCFNVRAITKQIPNCTLDDIETQLAINMKFCTPHIAINGDIKLGESDLCPACASIYDSEKTIIQKIKEFKCHGCDLINDRLPDSLKKFVT